MHIWLVEALGLILYKANFFLQQRNTFLFYYEVYAIIEKVPPTQSENSQIINNPIH